MKRSKVILAAAFSSLSLLATQTEGAPLPEACEVSHHERQIIKETSRWRVDTGKPEDFSNLRGCAVVSVTVSSDGSVKSAKVLRHRGAGVSVWQTIVMRQRYAPRNHAWDGLVEFRSVAAPDE